MAETFSALGGLLVRGDDGWRWRDGSPEPRVRDLTAAEAFQFPRVRSVDPRTGVAAGYVAIPRTALAEDADLLGAVVEEAGERVLDAGPTLEVPEELWDAWAPAQVIGLGWEPDDESEILRRAEGFGVRLG